MSWWIERKSKDGRRSLWAIDVDFTTIMVLVGLASTIVYQAILRHPDLIYLGPFAVMNVGATMILVAKIPQYRKRMWNSWGTASMSPAYARLYRLGYALFVLGGVGVIVGRFLHNQAL